MKRTEISEGFEAYFSETNTYLQHRYGAQGKATVIMVAAVRMGPAWESPARYRKVEPGDRSWRKAKVLIVLERDNGSAPERRLVTLAQLRGPYAETLAEVERSWAAIDALEREHTSKAVERMREAEAQVAGLKRAMGLEDWDAARVSGNYSSDPQVLLTRRGAKALLDLLADKDARIGALTEDLETALHAAQLERASEV